MNKSQILHCSIIGLIAGCIEVLLILTKKQLQLPQFFLFILQLAIIILFISLTIKKYRISHENHSDKIALNLGHITFIVAGTTFIIFRYFNGWYTNKSIIITILGIATFFILGRILTYLIISFIKR